MSSIQGTFTSAVPAINLHCIHYHASRVAPALVLCHIGCCEPGMQLSLCCLSLYSCVHIGAEAIRRLEDGQKINQQR